MEPVSRLRLKLLLTVAILAVMGAGIFLPLPGFDSRWLQAAPPSPAPIHYTVFGAGIGDYVGAAVILLVLSGLIPPLRRLRDGDADHVARFDRWIVALFLLLVGLQALGRILMLPQLYRAPVVALLTQTAGAAVLLGLAVAITRHGVGNGIAWIILGGILLQLPYHVYRVHQHLDIPGYHRAALPVLAVAVGVVLLQLRFLRRRFTLRLVPRGNAPGASPEVPLTFTQPVHAVGVVPILAVGLLTGTSSRIWSWAHPLTLDWHWFLYLALVAAATLFFTAVVTDGSSTAAILRRYGYRDADAGPEADPTRALENRLNRLVPGTVLFVVVLAALPGALEPLLRLPPGSGDYLAVQLLIAEAIILDLQRQIWVQHRLEEAAGAFEEEDEEPPEESAEPGDPEAEPGPEDVDGEEALDEDEDVPDGPPPWIREMFRPSPDWVVVARCEVELEAHVLRHVLAGRGIPAEVLANRWLPAMGTLGLWSVSRPRYPSVVPHRSLGGGQVVLLAPAFRAEEALAAVVAAVQGGEAHADLDRAG